MTLDHFTLSVVAGAVAGALDVIPMIAQRIAFRSCLSAFCTYLFAGVLIFHSNLPYLPWWADGSATVLMIAVPVMLCLVGKDRKAAPAIFMNAVILGFLISVSKHYLT